MRYAILLLLLLQTLISNAQQRSERQYVSPAFNPAATVKVLSTPGDQTGVARLELALLEAGFRVISDDRLRTNLTTATTTVQLADTTFRRPYREPVGIRVVGDYPSNYVATANGEYTLYRGEVITTRTDVRFVDTTTGELVATYQFSQRCTLSSEPLSATFRRLARGLRAPAER